VPFIGLRKNDRSVQRTAAICHRREINRGGSGHSEAGSFSKSIGEERKDHYRNARDNSQRMVSLAWRLGDDLIWREEKPGRMAGSVEGGVDWLKLSRPRVAGKPAAQTPTIKAPAIQTLPVEADDRASEPPKPAPSPVLQISAAMPPLVPAKSPKATFDTFADESRSVRPAPKPKIGFTITSSKDGETSEVQLTSPTLTVAKARMLFKSGWRVHITNAAGRQFAPSEFDEVLKFD
jgi:hypothetical protein